MLRHTLPQSLEIANQGTTAAPFVTNTAWVFPSRSITCLRRFPSATRGTYTITYARKPSPNDYQAGRRMVAEWASWPELCPLRSFSQ